MILYRPMGQKEFDLVVQSNYTKFPPRLPEQPIFYPVLNLEYARQISKWNVDNEGISYIVKFEQDDDYMKFFDIQIVGAKDIAQEYWIPAEELDVFNFNIVGRKIELVETITK